MRLRLALGVLACLLPVGGLGVPPAEAGEGPHSTRPGRVLVVSANVREIGLRDIHETRDMWLFVHKVLRQAPAIPDVMLLQEVNGFSQARILAILSRQTHKRWKVVVGPPRHAFHFSGERYSIGLDTAILMNASTMKRIGSGGRFTTSYKPRYAAPGHRVMVKKHAHALLRRRHSRYRVAVASIHYPTTPAFESDEVSHMLKTRWNRKVAERMASLYPERSWRWRQIVGGDFNDQRCAEMLFYHCPKSKAWTTMTRGLGYTDSIFCLERAGSAIDFIFTDGNTSDAGTDEGRHEYSDHAFRWSLVEMVDETPPLRVFLPSGSNSGPGISLGDWHRPADCGSGFKRFVITRSTSGVDGPYAVVGSTGDSTFLDQQTQPFQTYWYRLRPADREDNRARALNTKRVTENNH